jgi:hypothetical protein
LDYQSFGTGRTGGNVGAYTYDAWLRFNGIDYRGSGERTVDVLLQPGWNRLHFRSYASGIAAVPEPGGAGLAAAGLILLIARICRRGRRVSGKGGV